MDKNVGKADMYTLIFVFPYVIQHGRRGNARVATILYIQFFTFFTAIVSTVEEESFPRHGWLNVHCTLCMRICVGRRDGWSQVGEA